MGEGIHQTQGTVQSVSEQTDQVTVELDRDVEEPRARYASTVRVPLTRVQPLRNEVREDAFCRMVQVGLGLQHCLHLFIDIIHCKLSPDLPS